MQIACAPEARNTPHQDAAQTGAAIASQFRKDKFIGNGGSGSVFMVTRVSDGHRFALKVRHWRLLPRFTEAASHVLSAS